ncbi:hypothetical protein Q9R08_10705 [Microbacterium sp. QXD-8]|uniref:Uncharacterized protein n=1 Tax=Microbacterium psychrotolerans TaxID=3068321 RepID=A0ABU0Z391_9MICO|nr:hypothetical protein [Microbacterium sp. QXD-8]MDQ7878445.1 hypothetical protein [Microbacterium sp. QXD-8]
MARRSAILGIAVLLCLTGCAGGPMTEPTPSEPTSSEPTPSAHTRPPFATTPRGPIAPTGEPAIVPPARWDAIVADLAARGVTGTPELKSAHAVTWNNGALGCPSPGVSYTQALVDGMRVVVSVDGTTYDYRFGTSDSPKLCTR